MGRPQIPYSHPACSNQGQQRARDPSTAITRAMGQQDDAGWDLQDAGGWEGTEPFSPLQAFAGKGRDLLLGGDMDGL